MRTTSAPTAGRESRRTSRLAVEAPLAIILHNEVYSSHRGRGLRMFDVIVIGARCGGSPTAMLLARNGHRVLLVDRATFPSDTMSTHFVHPPGLARLASWGLLDGLMATGCPPVTRMSFDVGPFSLVGSAPGVAGIAFAAAPRRTVLDSLLAEAAVSSGVELRESFTVNELTTDGEQATGIRGKDRDGRAVAESARLVVGADGLHC